MSVKHRKALPHGTISGYVNWRCRCDECRQAKRDYYGNQPRAEYLAAIEAAHGTESRYKRGCRCDPCREATRLARARRRAAEDQDELRRKWREYQRRKAIA